MVHSSLPFPNTLMYLSEGNKVELCTLVEIKNERIIVSYSMWLILGVIAFVVEMMMPTFFSLFAGVGFCCAAAVSFFFPELMSLQLIVASVFMIIGAIVFKKRRFGDSGQNTVGTHNEFVGIHGIVKRSLSQHHEGEVELYEPIVGTRIWAAVSSGVELSAGDEVQVIKLNGNTVIVEKI